MVVCLLVTWNCLWLSFDLFGLFCGGVADLLFWLLSGCLCGGLVYLIGWISVGFGYVFVIVICCFWWFRSFDCCVVCLVNLFIVCFCFGFADFVEDIIAYGWLCWLLVGVDLVVFVVVRLLLFWFCGIWWSCLFGSLAE